MPTKPMLRLRGSNQLQIEGNTMTDNLPPLPTPDTHCFDDDTGKDVWSHSPDQLEAYARAIIEASRTAVPAGWVMVPRSLIDAFPEINPSNYNHDDACDLNRWGCEVVTTAVAAPQPVAQPGEQAQQAIDALVCAKSSLDWYRGVCPEHVAGDDDEMDQQIEAAIAALQVTQAKPERAAQPTQAAIDVLAERQRQISAEGWTPEHDDEHEGGELSQAAACYALHSAPVGNARDYLRFWPWDARGWKPKDSRSDLIKAGALILAEIERLDRAASPKPKD